MRRILGLVLAGGESRRFGSDKALAEVAGQPLVTHAVDSLRPVTEAVVLCGRSYLDLPCLADRPGPGLGPLGGLNAGLHHALAEDYSYVLSLACDTPFMPPAALARLAAQKRACAVAEHPVIGIWPATLAPSLDTFLRDDDRRSMRGWIRWCGADELSVGGIANINRPEDLHAYLAGADGPPHGR